MGGIFWEVVPIPSVISLALEPYPIICVLSLCPNRLPCDPINYHKRQMPRQAIISGLEL